MGFWFICVDCLRALIVLVGWFWVVYWLFGWLVGLVTISYDLLIGVCLIFVGCLGCLCCLLELLFACLNSGLLLIAVFVLWFMFGCFVWWLLGFVYCSFVCWFDWFVLVLCCLFGLVAELCCLICCWLDGDLVWLIGYWFDLIRYLVVIIDWLWVCCFCCGLICLCCGYCRFNWGCGF